MCGIAGIIHFDRGRRVDNQLINSMSQKLAHRGPDDSGCYVDGSIGLGFRRLSIIDLNTGNQPLFNEDNTIISVCNGEIFNYKDLKSDLIARGHVFRTKTDVEVLLHLYETWGLDFITRLKGQFAFAIYNKSQSQLILARDHVGIAPLFYTVFDDSLIFASEIKAILQYPNMPRRLNLKTLDQIFTFPGSISPATMFEGIYALKPGHFLVLKDRDIKIREYWDLVYPEADETDKSLSEDVYIKNLESALRHAVETRLQADVPVGFYLSGGLDSSLVAAMIAKIHGEKRHSFSIGFSQNDIDERRYQKIMTDAVLSIPHETVFDWIDIAGRLKQAVYCAETPLKESYDTCSLALSGLVRENGVKVVLTGEGADELFAGYVGYRLDNKRHGESDDSGNAEFFIEREIRDRLWGDPNFFYERNFYEFNETKTALYSEELADIFSTFDCTAETPVDINKIRNRHPIHKRSYIDFKLRIADHLLADHGDRVCFANSVEARYPFLDTDLIEIVKTIPPNMLINGNIEKYILKKLGQKHLPQAITEREKFAFVAPGSPYLIRQDIEWIKDILSFETIKRQGYFNPYTVERLKNLYSSENFSLSQTFENDLLMIVLTFGIFIELYHM